MEQKERSKEASASMWSDDPQRKLELDMLLADARQYVDTPEIVSECASIPESECLHTDDEKETGQPVPGTGTDDPKGDSAKTMEMQIRELTEEVRLLRSQLSQTQKENFEAEAAERSADIKKEPETGGKNKVMNVISNILFYLVIIGIVVGAFLVKSSSGGRPTMIAGFSAFRVLSSSMEDAYPKGSLIITKAVDPNELVVGDDITFMVSETSSVTHRIIGITQNYAGTGKPGFETKGVMNEKADKDMVAAANVVGKVVFSSKFLGDLAIMVKDNWPIMLFVVAVFMALITFLKWNARREDDGETQPQKAASPKHTRK